MEKKRVLASTTERRARRKEAPATEGAAEKKRKGAGHGREARHRRRPADHLTSGALRAGDLGRRAWQPVCHFFWWRYGFTAVVG
jgi:hypothetical protein